MMDPRQIDQAALLYEFSLERHVPATHVLRSIDRFVDLSHVGAMWHHSTVRPAFDRSNNNPQSNHARLELRLRDSEFA
jgi:hypothetical protein